MTRKSIEERLAGSYTFRAFKVADDWEIPVVKDLLRNVLRRRASRMREEDDLGRLAFLKENGNHPGHVQHDDLEPSTRLEKVDDDLARLRERQKFLERKKALEESKKILF